MKLNHLTGLSPKQLADAVKLLLKMGGNAQRSHYNEWFAGSSARMAQGVG